VKKQDIAWCPGCGNFAILNAVNKAIAEMNLDRKNLVFVSGIGQAAKRRSIWTSITLTACTGGLCRWQSG